MPAPKYHAAVHVGLSADDLYRQLSCLTSKYLAPLGIDLGVYNGR